MDLIGFESPLIIIKSELTLNFPNRNLGFCQQKCPRSHPNDTLYGLGAGVWTRDMHQAYQISRAVEAGRVWVNCYHAYPAHAPFGGYKKSGIGRETHKMMLDHYRQTKNMLISYDKQKLGFF
jgi:hypothetical protein